MFHEWIGEELTKIKEGDLIEPEREIDLQKDHFLDEMSEGLKKLFTLWRKTSQAIEAAKNTSTEALKKIVLELPTKELGVYEREEIKQKVRQVEMPLYLALERERATEQAFWISVMDEFPGASDKPLAVCKGFKVVWFEDRKKSVCPVCEGVEVVILG